MEGIKSQGIDVSEQSSTVPSIFSVALTEEKENPGDVPAFCSNITRMISIMQPNDICINTCVMKESMKQKYSALFSEENINIGPINHWSTQ
jgi:hypothetical protein